jgi:hypothetical protein
MRKRKENPCSRVTRAVTDVVSSVPSWVTTASLLLQQSATVDAQNTGNSTDSSGMTPARGIFGATLSLIICCLGTGLCFAYHRLRNQQNDMQEPLINEQEQWRQEDQLEREGHIQTLPISLYQPPTAPREGHQTVVLSSN